MLGPHEAGLALLMMFHVVYLHHDEPTTGLLCNLHQDVELADLDA